MEKNWFILDEGHHKGPFSSPEVVDLFVNGKVLEDDLLWKDGEDDWQALTAFDELTTMIEFQGTTMDVNVSDVSLAKYRSKQRQKQMALNQAKAKAELLKFNEEQEADSLPPLPSLPSIDEDIEEVVESILSPETEAEAEPEQAIATEPKNKKGFFASITFKQWAMTFTCLAFLMLSITFSFKGNDWDSWIVNYPKPIQEKFLKTLNTQGPVQTTFHWDYVEKQLYGVINRGGNGAVEVEFSSLKDKIIGDKPVVIKAKGHLKNNQIQFKAIQFEKGEEVLPGHYDYKIKGFQSSALIHLLHYFDFKDLSGYEKVINKEGTIILAEGTDRIFNQALGLYNKKKKMRQLRPAQELLQQYRTFNSLLIEINNAYTVQLNRIKTGKEIKRFEKQYMKNIGPLLQGLILDNYKTKDQLKEKNPKQAEVYTRLISFGKKITSLAVEMSRRTKPLGKLRASTKKRLKNEFSVKVDMLKQKAQMRMEHFNNQITELNKL